MLLREKPQTVGGPELIWPCVHAAHVESCGPADVCVGLRLQQVMKTQWQSKSLERSKPLKKLSLKNKLSSSKEKHKFTSSLMAVSEYTRGDDHIDQQATNNTDVKKA